MHYDMRAFSSNGMPTIVPKQRNAQIGQRNGFSSTDSLKINQLYQCATPSGFLTLHTLYVHPASSAAGLITTTQQSSTWAPPTTQRPQPPSSTQAPATTKSSGSFSAHAIYPTVHHCRLRRPAQRLHVPAQVLQLVQDAGELHARQLLRHLRSVEFDECSIE